MPENLSSNRRSTGWTHAVDAVTENRGIMSISKYYAFYFVMLIFIVVRIGSLRDFYTASSHPTAENDETESTRVPSENKTRKQNIK